MSDNILHVELGKKVVAGRDGVLPRVNNNFSGVMKNDWCVTLYRLNDGLWLSTSGMPFARLYTGC